ncbi:MAG: DNA-binding protein [Clostridiales bacterium]|jgi:predicted DNA-binding protein with PD1-like motif|nr:DNA-binding protein [Clostridiales bacterium]
MSSAFVSESTGRAVLIHMTVGDRLLETIREEAKRLNIQSAIVTGGIGSLRKAVYHYIEAVTEEPRDAYKTVERPMELVSLQGIVLEGEPHLHMAATEEGGGVCHSGHVEEGCEIQYLAEISLIELKNLPLGRRAEKYGTVTHFELLNGGNM